MQQRLFLLKCQQTILCNPGNSWRIRKQLFWKETALLMFWPIEHLNQGNWRTETSSLSEASGIALAHTAMWTHPPLQASRKLAQTVNKKNFQSAKKKKKKKKKAKRTKHSFHFFSVTGYWLSSSWHPLIQHERKSWNQQDKPQTPYSGCSQRNSSGWSWSQFPLWAQFSRTQTVSIVSGSRG